MFTSDKCIYNHCQLGTKVFYECRAGVTKFGPGGPVSLQNLAPTLIKHT